MASVDYYAVLGVSRTASHTEIRRAWRKRQRETHPDTGGTNESFDLVMTAYSVVGDDRKRRAYDATLDSSAPRTGELPGWSDTPIYDDLAARFGASRRAENEAYMGEAYAEQVQWFERARKRHEDYLASMIEDELMFEPESKVGEAARQPGVWGSFVLVIVATLAYVFMSASNPDRLIQMLPVLGIAVGVAFLVIAVCGWLWTVYEYSPSKTRANLSLWLLCLLGILAGTAFVITYSVLVGRLWVG